MSEDDDISIREVDLPFCNPWIIIENEDGDNEEVCMHCGLPRWEDTGDERCQHCR